MKMQLQLLDATVSTPIPPAQIPDAPHVFSMSCKVTAVNGDLATPDGRDKAIAWWRRTPSGLLDDGVDGRAD